MQREFPVTVILSELQRDDLLPAILFRTSRRQCDNDVEKLSQDRFSKLTVPEQMRLRKEVKRIIEKYDVPEEIVFEHPQYNSLIYTGAGAHHAGQLLIWRILLEELMTRGLLRLMIATGTVAAGVDFPARTVIITAHSKRGSAGFRVLTSAEFQQMSGRAGRRGKDTVGMCLIAPSPFSDARVLAEVAKKPPEPLKSCYFASPSTVLNLLRYRSVDDLRYTVDKSLASFLDRRKAAEIRQKADEKEQDLKTNEDLPEAARKKINKRIRRERRQADELESEQLTLLDKSLAGLEALEYLKDGKLTDKGFWAANLCTTLVLEIAEAINEGLFTDLSLYELVALLGSISGDSHKSYLDIKRNPLPKEMYQRLQEMVDRVGEAYDRPPSSDQVAVIPEAGLTAAAWMEADNWLEFAGVLRLGGVAEGDVARLISQTADHLHQISRLSDSHPVLAAAAEEGRRAILKPPLSEVLAESQSQV